MKIQVFHLFFKTDCNGNLVPTDDQLYSLATNYAAENLTDQVDFRDYKNSWVACEIDESGQPVRCHGLLCMVLRPDFPIVRFTDGAAIVKLVQRANDHLHDVYGLRGSEVLINFNENEPVETRCPNRMEWMKAYGCRPANRWTYKIR